MRKPDWEESKIILTASAAAGVEGTGRVLPWLRNESKVEFWRENFNPWGIDKFAHFSGNYALDKVAMKAMEKTPEYLEELSEKEIQYISDAASWTREHYFDTLVDPDLLQKAVFAVGVTTVVGGSKEELLDPYFDWYDMGANYVGTAAAIVDEYGDGSIVKGVKNIGGDITELLEEDREDINEDVYENMEALGKI